MAQVHFSAGQRRLTGGVAHTDVDAATVRELLRKLEEMFPGIRAHLDQTASTAIAIDGDIIPDPLYEPIPADAEVHFIAPLAGG
ncbi:MAG: MoaD/ThiS family protein [bacterium]|nr:MoaD/ThiS family protein [bacterium]MXZ30187.1 MoaD/ThiS family protein [Acidimicrobiia bacterium]MDE0669713.1 MoaD/ThiS family protein [bacterium]MYB24233.1 MoaD/ThiS family protein [Acidimicrobiia bacterium]MYE67239.1 MoaD/ThiS family protein [Acidimicrobiia bacterium]